MDVKDLAITHELFPKPFFIHQGHFRFDRDKMWFETFQANYGKSDLQLDGFVENAINYVLAKNEILKANFNLKSKNIDLNEFTVYASASSTRHLPNHLQAASSTSSSTKLLRHIFNSIVYRIFRAHLQQHRLQDLPRISSTASPAARSAGLPRHLRQNQKRQPV